MRILYIHQYFKTPDEPGGTRSYWFAKELIKQGHQVTMLTGSYQQKNFIERKNRDGIDVIYVRVNYDQKMNVGQRLLSFIKFMCYSAWIGLRQKNTDLVFATSTPLTVAIPALIIKWLKGVPFIFEVRDLWPEVPIQMGAIKNKMLIRLLYSFEKKIYRSARHIVALSPGMRKGVLKYGIPPEKVSMIPNMSKKDEFYIRPKNDQVAKEFGIDLNKFNVIHFGSMGLANGLDYIIDGAVLLNEMNAENINIIFLGKGRTEEVLKERCRREKLDNVKFLGFHPMKITSEVVNICDCSIVSFSNIPILQTNSPNKLFDALSAGKPLIVNSPGWTRAMVEENQCGIYVDPEKPEALATALIDLSKNPAEIEKMAGNSRRLAEEVYDKSILCRQFLQVIEQFNTARA